MSAQTAKSRLSAILHHDTVCAELDEQLALCREAMERMRKDWPAGFLETTA